MLKLLNKMSKVPRVLESDTKTGTLSGNVQFELNTIIVAESKRPFSTQRRLGNFVY